MTRRLAVGLLVAAAYIAAARVGLRVALVAEQVTMVWPPTGIAQAALFLWGPSLWPAIWIAAFAVNAATHIPPAAAAGIATGNTLEALVAALILTRVFRFDPALKRVRDAAAFIAVAVTGTTMLSASIGAAVLCASGAQPWPQFGDIWLDWWLGDAMGSLVVAPAILTIARGQSRLTNRQRRETAIWTAAATIVTAVIFGHGLTSITGHMPIAFVIFPFVIVAAVRLGQPATALVLAGTAVATLTNTILDSGPFAGAALRERLILVQMFMGVLAGSGLLLAAATTERRISDQRKTAVYGVGEVLSHANNLTESAPNILRVIGESLQWDVGALWCVDTSIDRLRSVAMWSAQPAPDFLQATRDTVLPPGLGLPGRVWSSAEPAWIQDVADDPNFPRAAIARKEGLHGAFGFPLKTGDQIFGVVEFFNRSVAAPDPDLLTTMSALGSEVARFIDQKRTEASARHAQHGTRAILDTALDAIISMDDRGMITEFNPAAERMFGHRRTDVVGRELAEAIIPRSLRDAHRAGFARCLATGEGRFINRRIETIAMRANGEEFPAEISITRVPTDPPIFTGFVRDITERAQAEFERRRLLDRELEARREAETANRAKDEFLATLSHELRTPLNAIVGWSRMLLDGSLDEETTRRALQVIDRNAQTQVQLVADILDVSRIITGKLNLDVQPVDIGTIIGSVLDGVRPAAEAKQIRLRSKLSAKTRLTRGDPQRLQQVLWNLVSNALKFTPQGGAIDVEVDDAGGDMVAITVSDTGVGIAPEFLNRVFERFSQADSSSTRQHGGLGLGLAIVRHLVELHGGTVRAESSGVNKGARFIVNLPKLKDEEVAATAEVRSPLPDTAAASEAVLSGCHVLVVEDEHDARELLKTVLTSAGAAVRLATTAKQALSAIEAKRPDVLLSDIGLVGEDGFAFMQEIRRREHGGARLPSAAITAYARREDRERALDAGFDQYLAKPFQPRAVIDVVMTLWKTA